MMNITKGMLAAGESLVVVGEYWTCEAPGEHNTICISYNEKLISVEKADFADWLQLNHLLARDNELPAYPATFDPMDMGMDVE